MSDMSARVMQQGLMSLPADATVAHFWMRRLLGCSRSAYQKFEARTVSHCPIVTLVFPGLLCLAPAGLLRLRLQIHAGAEILHNRSADQI